MNNGGTSKVKSVTAAPISTVHAGSQTIKATVTDLTFLVPPLSTVTAAFNLSFVTGSFDSQ